MIEFSTKYRSKQAEIMDDLQFKGNEMKDVLTDLKCVNKLLGGNSITIDGIRKLLKGKPKDRTYTILDIGCGDGEMLRKCAQFGIANGFKFQLIGIDANLFILEEARLRSRDFQNISYNKIDVFSNDIKEVDYDIALCTLFLHHFKTSEVTQIMNNLVSSAKVGAVVNDLQRNRLAFLLFRLFSLLFLKTKIAKHDGLVSVARGFLRKEIESIAKEINASKSQLHWKWAFRYQWILIR